jgi:hypothetical protein
MIVIGMAMIAVIDNPTNATPISIRRLTFERTEGWTLVPNWKGLEGFPSIKYLLAEWIDDLEIPVTTVYPGYFLVN